MSLGVGSYQIMLADRAGVKFGELRHISSLIFTFERDDFGAAMVTLNNPEANDCATLENIHTIRHEMLILRDGVVVWEGPITRIGWYAERIEIDAKDVSWYLTRRAFNYSAFDYAGQSGVNATEAVMRALRHHYPLDGDPTGPDPWRIGEHLMAYGSIGAPYDGDPKTAAKYDPFSLTLYDFLQRYVDRGGLDYVVRGRSIILYPHRVRVNQAVKLMPEHFVQQPAIIEYGSQVFTRAVTTLQNGGYYVSLAPEEWLNYYGTIDKVINNTEDAEDTEADGTVQQLTELQVQDSYPAPVEVQVPANSTVAPDSPNSFQDLLPGTYIPIEARVFCKTVTRMQVIDRTAVTWVPGQEQVAITTMQVPTVYNDGEVDNSWKV